MSLLTIATNVCAIIGFPKPTAVAGSADQLSRQLFALANRELQQASQQYVWPILQKEYSFNSVVGQQSYPMPSDYDKYIMDTAYQSSDYWRIRGSVSPQEWQFRRAQLLGTIDRTVLRIYGNPPTLNLLPPPDDVRTLVFEYSSKYFAKDVDGVLKPRFTVDTDTPIISEDLIELGLKWRLQQAKGLEYGDAKNEWEVYCKTEFAKELAAPTIQIGGYGYNEYAGLTDGYVRENGFGG